MTLYGSLIVNSTDTFSEHYCQNKSISTSININGNISYESILKHRKYGNCDSFVCFFIHRESYEDILTTISPLSSIIYLALI